MFHILVSDEVQPKLYVFSTDGKLLIHDRLTLARLRMIDEPGPVESLCESMSSGFASLQDYARLHDEANDDLQTKHIAKENAL